MYDALVFTKSARQKNKARTVSHNFGRLQAAHAPPHPPLLGTDVTRPPDRHVRLAQRRRPDELMSLASNDKKRSRYG